MIQDRQSAIFIGKLMTHRQDNIMLIYYRGDKYDEFIGIRYIETNKKEH